jgi:hypothetical protein
MNEPVKEDQPEKVTDDAQVEPKEDDGKGE